MPGHAKPNTRPGKKTNQHEAYHEQFSSRNGRARQDGGVAMAGDWIKLEKHTPDKREIAILAKRQGVSVGDALLNFIRVYRWADGATADGSVPHLSLSDVDALSGALPGTCEALASPEIGWMQGSDAGIQFTNWERHNGTSARQRLYEREKKRRQRDFSKSTGTGSGTTCGTANGTQPGPEKRREEKNVNTDASASTRSKPQPSNVDIELAEMMASRITEMQPKRVELRSDNRSRTLLTWANDFRLMRERDGRSPDDVRSLIDWVYRDNFWKGNILSAGKLREKFDDLTLRKNSNHKGNGNGRTPQYASGPGQRFRG